MLKLLPFLKPYWKAVLLAPLLMLVEVFADLLQPRLMASIVDHGVLAGDLAQVQHNGLLMLGIALIGLLGGVGCTIYSSIAAQRFGADLREELFRKVQAFSYRNMERFSAGSIIVRLTNDVNQVQQFVQMLLRIMVRAPLLSLGSLIMAFSINWKLALLLLAVIPLLFAIIIVIVRLGFPLFGLMQQKLDDTNSVLQENLAGIRVVKAFVRAAHERIRFGKSNDAYMETAVKAGLVMAAVQPVMFLVLNASIIAVLWFGANYVWAETLALGELIAFINYVTQLLFSLMMIGMMIVGVSRAQASAQRISEVLATEPEIPSPNGLAEREGAGEEARHLVPGTLEMRKGRRLEFDQVSFAYEDGRDVLHSISFMVEPGQTIGIIGAIGSGKSTLAKLIPRLYEAGEGQIRIDGIDIRKLDPAELRRDVGIVLQAPVLFSGTIGENITYAKPDASEEDMVAAAEAAQAAEFIARMPEQYGAVIGQRGVNLSGGQKQRLSLARAWLADPGILILDDSTSAVDSITEARIREALQQRRAGRTNLIIAQRISSVASADRILVLDEGRLVAEGTHEELLASSSIYQDIYRSQYGVEEVAADGR